jgi:hypothetical protein
LQFKCKENNKLFSFFAKGTGISYTIEIIEDSVEMGPVLPYDKSSMLPFQIKNPMSFPIEVYSTDFDQRFVEEEDILRRFDPLMNGELLFEKLRKAGMDFWPNIREIDEKERNYEAMQSQLELVTNRLNSDEFKPDEPAEGEDPQPLAEEKVEEQKKLEEEQEELKQKIIEFEAEKHVKKKVIRKVKERDRLNVIIVGPEKSGKSTVAYFLSEEQERGIVNMNELLTWCEKKSSPSYEEVAKYLAEREEECKVQEELDKKKKKK